MLDLALNTRDFSSPPTQPVLASASKYGLPTSSCASPHNRWRGILLAQCHTTIDRIRARVRMDALAWDHLRELLDACAAYAFKEYSNGKCSQGTRLRTILCWICR